MMEVVPQCACALNASLWGWRQRFLGRQHGMKGCKEAPAVRSTFSCVFEAPQALMMDLLMGSLKSLRHAGVVGDMGDGHSGFESDVWAAQRAHAASPSRGRRLHDTGGPRDAVPH